MTISHRQDIARFDEIESGDSVTYRSHDRYTLAYDYETSGGRLISKRVTDPDRWFYVTGKVAENTGQGWRVVLGKDDSHIVTRDDFWALRKARGRGKTGDNRFDPDDAIAGCQICSGRWLANTGRIPHHGYQRPGWGLQTQSCSGALQVPYQVHADPKQRVPTIGRDVLPSVISQYEQWLASEKAHLDRVIAGTAPVPSRLSAWRVTKDIPANDPRRSPVEPGAPDYEQCRVVKERSLIRDIAQIGQGLDELRHRFDLWQPGGEGVLTAPTPAPTVSPPRQRIAPTL